MYLLDTHVLLWANTAPELLSAKAREVIQSRQIQVSVVSFWELLLKKGKKDAPVLDPVRWWERYVTLAMVEVLPIRVHHVARLDLLPELHRDPFDRMLISQAQSEALSIVTMDEAIMRYDVKSVWS